MFISLAQWMWTYILLLQYPQRKQIWCFFSNYEIMYWTFSYFIVMMWEKWDHFKSPMETNAQSPSNITMISFCILFAVARHSNNQHWVNIFNAISKACTAYCPHATSQTVLIYYLWHYLHILKILKIMYVCSMRFAVFFSPFLHFEAV